MQVNILVDLAKVNLGKRLFMNAQTNTKWPLLLLRLTCQNKQATNKQIHTHADIAAVATQSSCGNITAMQLKPEQPFRPNQGKNVSWKSQLLSCCYRKQDVSIVLYRWHKEYHKGCTMHRCYIIIIQWKSVTWKKIKKIKTFAKKMFHFCWFYFMY